MGLWAVSSRLAAGPSPLCCLEAGRGWQRGKLPPARQARCLGTDAGLPVLWEFLPTEKREVSEVGVVLGTFLWRMLRYFSVIQGHCFVCQHITEISFTESFTVILGR